MLQDFGYKGTHMSRENVARRFCNMSVTRLQRDISRPKIKTSCLEFPTKVVCYVFGTVKC